MCFHLVWCPEAAFGLLIHSCPSVHTAAGATPAGGLQQLEHAISLSCWHSDVLIQGWVPHQGEGEARVHVCTCAPRLGTHLRSESGSSDGRSLEHV